VAKSLSGIAEGSDIERFAFCFARTYCLPSRAFGISPSTAFVDVGDGKLDAHVGPWRVSTCDLWIPGVEWCSSLFFWDGRLL
jgi:hypothetical protein